MACYNNKIVNLDVSHNPALGNVRCGGNSLTSLDISKNPALSILECSNNLLTNLDVSKNTVLEWLVLKSIPSLYKVCVWKMPFPPTGVTVDTTDSLKVYFTTDCSK